MQTYSWLQFKDKTYIPDTHPKYQEYMDKYLNPKEMGKTITWSSVKAVNPPEHYGLKLLDIH